MVELPSCASLVSASTFRAIEHEGKGEIAVNAIAEISAELQRERQRNAELMERISVLEAQIRERDEEHSLLAGGQGSCQNTGNRKPKRQKVTTNLRKKEKKERQKVTTNVPKKEEEEERQKVTTNVRKEEEEERQKVATNVRKIEDEDIKTDLEMKHNNSYAPLKDMNVENRLVNWMNTDDTESLSSEMLKESDSAADCKDTDESDDEDEEEDGENDICTNHEGGENCMDVFRAKSVKEQSSKRDMITEEAADAQCLVSSTSGHDEPKDITVNRECNGYLVEKDSNLSIDPVHNTGKYIKHHGKAINVTEGYQEASKTCIPGQEIKRDGDISLHKRHPKIAFCPKEVKRIIESEELSLKNAQSHTIRKIIVFASLGIRHGCEDMYELDFNHFAILRKGEPYVSSKDPGEHVLYENPGVRRKIFYPNLQNPTLCPVQILEEEKAMRPSDASCPSFLFLCIKYGGRTRNIPQNEYVRQRMGRNKLKSFGPAICRMAMLVHTRSGSFFFKALGITLLCMAGFANELVQRETKYRNLDLLYRIDEDAEGEELFLSRSATNDTGVRPISPQLMGKKMLAKFKSRKATKVVRKDQEKAMFLQSAPSNSGPPSKFKLLRTVSIQTQAITPVQYITSQAQADFSVPNPLISSISSNVPNSNQLSSYSIIPTHPASPFFPIIYWPPSNAFFPCPHPSLQSYRYPLARNYISSYPQPNHGNPVSSTIAPKSLKDSWKDDAAASEAGNDSKSSSSSTEPTKVENQTN